VYSRSFGPTLRAFNPPHYAAHKVEADLEVGVGDVVEIRLGQFAQRRMARVARVVDQDVDFAEPLEGFVAGRANL
jgi:hypothetical protein